VRKSSAGDARFMNRVYLVFDDHKNIIAAFDDKAKLDYFMNGHEPDWVIEDCPIDDTNERIFRIYSLILHPDSFEVIDYNAYTMPTYAGYCIVDRMTKNALFVDVQADSLDEAIQKVKEHMHDHA
jgi:hypothetical protein